MTHSSARRSPASCWRRLRPRWPVRGHSLEGAGSGSWAGGRLGFDDASLTVKQHARFSELLGDDWELVPCTGAVQRLRAVKDAGEIARIRAAAELADAALRGGPRRRARRAHRARGRDRARAAHAPPGRRGAELPLDRRRRRARRAAARRAARAADPGGRARDDRLGRAARGLLLGLHAHVRHRRGDLRAGARDLRARARSPGAGACRRSGRDPPAGRSTRSPAR